MKNNHIDDQKTLKPEKAHLDGHLSQFERQSFLQLGQIGNMSFRHSMNTTLHGLKIHSRFNTWSRSLFNLHAMHLIVSPTGHHHLSMIKNSVKKT